MNHYSTSQNTGIPKNWASTKIMPNNLIKGQDSPVLFTKVPDGPQTFGPRRRNPICMQSNVVIT